MNNSINFRENILKFPSNIFTKQFSREKQEDIQFEEGTIEYHIGRGLDLFKANLDLSDTMLLVDKQGELINLNPSNKIFLDGRPNIWKLLSHPSNSENLIRARESIINIINNLPEKIISKLYESREEVFKLNGFGIKFDHFEDLKGIIEELEGKKQDDDDNSNALCVGIFGFENINSLEYEKIRQLIPGHIQLIRNIGGEFFIKTADELQKLFKKARKYSLNDLKKIYEEQDINSFTELRRNVESFCEAYSYWDSILIVAQWCKSGYIETVENITHNSQKALSVRDPRKLLTDDIDSFLYHVSNDLPSDSDTEIYSGSNGSGKSTWLKSVLMLQLFYQNYGNVAAKNSELILRNQIVFINRGGSGYGEDLSAFGNDISNKLLPFLSGLQEQALVFLDEFGSTIPEEEAFYLTLALLDYLKKFGIKVYIATHNEKLINWVTKNKDQQFIVYNFKSTPKRDGTMKFSYKLIGGKDDANSFRVFKAAGLPDYILQRAKAGIIGGPSITQKIQLLPHHDIVSYSDEQREILKKQNKGFAGFSRYNEMVKWPLGNGKNYEILRKYKPLGYKNRPNLCYDVEDLFFSAYHPQSLGLEAPQISFDFIIYGARDSYNSNDFTRLKLKHLESKNIHKKNIFSKSNGTLSSIITWGLTNDIRELQERQIFFEKIGDWSYEDANKIYEKISIFIWIINNFQSSGGFFGTSLDFDYKQLSRFNQAYWEYFIDNLEEYLEIEGLGRICEWFIILVEMEEKLGNLKEEFREKNKEFLLKLKKTVILGQRYDRANNRKYKRFEKEFKTSSELSEIVCQRVKEIIVDLWGDEQKSAIETMLKLYSEINTDISPVDILNMDCEKRTQVITFLEEKRIFRGKQYGSDMIQNGFIGMTQLIRALKGSGNLMHPLLDKLRSFDSVHSNQIANYLEDFVAIPDVEVFINIVKQKRDNPNYNRSRYYLNINREHGCTAIMELLGLVDIANQIKKLGWTKVIYNNTGEIEVREMANAGVQKSSKDQVLNDVYLGKNQSFDIIEGATMGGKTFNIQAMQWVIRLSQSIGYVPAKYASLPVFDGLVYMDRILEDEKNKLSAGQNDAKAWSEIIKKIHKLVNEKSKNARYWFSIDEMISSVPARFQRGLVVSLIEELTILGQKGQLSIHNPDLVTRLLERNTDSYNIRHPEVKFDNNGNIDYTYKIVEGRSVDVQGNFTAYSLETAQKMGLPQEIIEKAKWYKQNNLF